MYICAPNEIDKKIILTEATEMYQLKEETVTAAMELEGALVVKDSAGILQAYIVFIMCLDEERFETRAMVIGLGYTDVYAIKMLVRRLRTIFKSVIYSLDALNRMKAFVKTNILSLPSFVINPRSESEINRLSLTQ